MSPRSLPCAQEHKANCIGSQDGHTSTCFNEDIDTLSIADSHTPYTNTRLRHVYSDLCLDFTPWMVLLAPKPLNPMNE